MRQIRFVEANAGAFVEALLSDPSSKERVLQIAGEGQLARDIAELAGTHGFTPNVVPLPGAGRERGTTVMLTEEGGRHLSAQLLSFIDADDVVLIAPVSDWHSSRRPLFLI